jgi:hypothetical protein
MKIYIKNVKILAIAVASAIAMCSCKKYLDNTQLPAGTIAGQDAFVSDNSVSAIVSGCMSSLNSSGPSTYGEQTSLYTDELVALPNTSSNQALQQLVINAVSASTINFWSPFYSKLYAVNQAIEGINSATAQLYYKNQWLGESYFLRAFDYYSLTNLYGGAALATTSNFNVNKNLARSPQSAVYSQIIADLKTAKSLLSTGYMNGYGVATTDRARPNRYTAEALLSKIYLANKDWMNAEAMADSVIANTATYQLVTPTNTFVINNQETIWAIATINDVFAVEYSTYNNGMAATIIKDPASAYSVQVAMSTSLINAFEPNDLRFKNWVRATTYTGVTPAVTYYFPNKYKSNVAGQERSVALRLADIYLVRAEARAEEGNVTGAQADINIIRTRAGLPNTTATTQLTLLAAIAQERRVELFTEGGNRFFDLRRTGSLDSTMIALRGSTVWSSYKQFWPIPITEIQYDPNLTQTPGY